MVEKYIPCEFLFAHYTEVFVEQVKLASEE